MKFLLVGGADSSTGASGLEVAGTMGATTSLAGAGTGISTAEASFVVSEGSEFSEDSELSEYSDYSEDSEDSESSDFSKLSESSDSVFSNVDSGG